jgi:hypothetical protein
MPLAAGTQIGRYEIRSLLGQGGMGEVYRAHDGQLGREVALKVLDASVAVDPERVHRFLQEARAASALNHPNIIAIYEAGESNNTRFIASELVEGRTLREMLADGPLSLTHTLDIAVQVASALAAAHVAGIVHRDVKPENIMVRPDGYAKVLDFGLAKLTDPSASGAHAAPDAAATMMQTTAGVIMGTVAYMSPEQARALKVDVRTDCYSLGAVIFEMITGRQPFTGATGTDVMVAILERDAPLDVLRREGLPAQLVWVLAKALDKNPDLRHQHAGDLRVDLERIRRDVATGAVYADHDAQTDRPSAILREVSDADADAIQMYRWSRATLVAAIVALAAVIALPLIYQRTLGASMRAPLAGAAAEIRARDFAAALGRPVDGREADTDVDNNDDLHLHAVRDAGVDTVRASVRDGTAVEWMVTFEEPVPADRYGRVALTLTPDGRLRSFGGSQREPPPVVTISLDEATARAAAAARQHLGVDPAAFKVEHAWRLSDGTAYDIEWRNPTPVYGHTEKIHAVLDDTGFRTLARRLEAPADPAAGGFWKNLNQFRGAVMIIVLAATYVFGIFVLARTRRWQMVGKRLPMALGVALALGFFGGTTGGDGDLVGMLALGAVGVLLAGGALPAIAGLVAWLKQTSAVRLHGAEQLAAGHLRSPAAAATLLAGLTGGAVLALLMLTHSAVGLHVAGFKPSISSEIGLASPGLYNGIAGWLAAAVAICLAVGFFYELPGRFVRRPWPILLALVIVAGPLAGDVQAGGKVLLISAITSSLCLAVFLILYGRFGLGAVFVAVVLWPLLQNWPAARALGGPLAGQRATIMFAVALVVAAAAAWSYAGSRLKAGVDNISSKSGIRS